MTICCISFHPCRSIRKQIWPCHKNGHGQGQPTVIIWTNLAGVPYIVYQVSRSSASWFRRRRFLKVSSNHVWAWKPSWSCETEHLNTSHGGSVWNLASNSLAFFEEKKSENVESEWPWSKVNEWPWFYVVINHHVLIYLTICTNFHLTGFNNFLEIYSLSIFRYKNKRDQTLL